MAGAWFTIYKKSIAFLKYALKIDLVKGEWFDLYYDKTIGEDINLGQEGR